MRIAVVTAMPPTSLRFDRGTLRIDAENTVELCADAIWDDRTACWRAPAYRYVRVLEDLKSRGIEVIDAIAPQVAATTGPWSEPPLRPYQRDALDAWIAFDQRGVIVLPTGSGKTRVAIAAFAAAKTSVLLLCPTRALLGQWKRELESWYHGAVGVVGDGESSIRPVTVMTFESGYRRLDLLGAKFGLVAVDEVHHFGSGVRCDALEMCPAPRRLGLTATPPKPGSAGDTRLCSLLGPVVFELGVKDLLGTHLAPLHVVRLCAVLDPEERARYEQLARPFEEHRRALVRAYAGMEYDAIVRTIARTPGGRDTLSAYHRAGDLAAFPRAKQRMVRSLLDRCRNEKTLVFTAYTDHAYTISADSLVPVITAEVKRAERDEILSRFRDGRYRVVVSSRVLNEGIDVPDANVAIVVGGVLGGREHVQRIGRVLRPAPGKTAVVYELVTAGTVDDSRARSREKSLVT